MNRSNSELSDLLDDDYAGGKLDGESSSDECDEKKQRNICYTKTTLRHPLPSKSLEPIHFIVMVKQILGFSTNKM
ncbi:hypothetical protein TNCV_1326911 [Trichonephila clavipes]|nr:hypothetical protein TNCV_1326911 [Trichonephila clavipes]